MATTSEDAEDAGHGGGAGGVDAEDAGVGGGGEDRPEVEHGAAGGLVVDVLGAAGDVAEGAVVAQLAAVAGPGGLLGPSQDREARGGLLGLAPRKCLYRRQR